MLFEGRIETTFQANFATIGLDTAGKRRLLDQRIALITKCRVVRKQQLPLPERELFILPQRGFCRSPWLYTEPCLFGGANHRTIYPGGRLPPHRCLRSTGSAHRPC